MIYIHWKIFKNDLTCKSSGEIPPAILFPPQQQRQQQQRYFLQHFPPIVWLTRYLHYLKTIYRRSNMTGAICSLIACSTFCIAWWIFVSNYLSNTYLRIGTLGMLSQESMTLLRKSIYLDFKYLALKHLIPKFIHHKFS